MPRASKKKRSDALYDAIMQLKSVDECKRFFDDLCTPNELRSMEQRFDVAVYLLQDRVYAEILEKTGASSATISRVRRNILTDSPRGAMQELIERMGLAPIQDENNPEE